MSRAAVLAGIGSYLPPRVVPNAELAARLDSSDEWIRARTGVAQRYYASVGTATSDLAAAAGERALESAGRSAVAMVVVATSTPDRPCPATAPTVSAKLGLRGAAAFDAGAVCSGFLYALAAAAGLVVTGVTEDALVIGADTFSSILDPDDRATSVVFGDGAGAVVLRAGDSQEPGAIGPFDLGSDGEGRDLITVRAGGSQQRLSGLAPPPRDHYFAMDGKKVFVRAIEHMAESSRAVLTAAGQLAEDVDWLVSHQANRRILDLLADSLAIARERVVGNIADVGNTAAASVPLALDHAHTAGRLRAGDRLLLTAFGGGLTWGSTVMTWPKIAPA